MAQDKFNAKADATGLSMLLKNRRSASVALIGPLVWECPYASGAALKNQKQTSP